MTGRHGFTLIEAVIALTIIGVAAAGALASFGAQLRGARAARESAELVALAQDVRARVALTNESPASLPDSLRRGRFEEPFATHRWEVRIEPAPGPLPLDRLTIRVLGPGGSFAVQSLASRAPAPARRP